MKPRAGSLGESPLDPRQRHANFHHRRIARLHLLSVATALILGTIIAIVARAAVALGSRGIIHSGLYNRAMTLHAIVMVFLGLIPGIPFALGPLVSPVVLGGELRSARRLGWTSLCLYWAAAILIIASIALGKFDTGLCYVVVFQAGRKGAVIGLTLGVFMVGLASAMNGYGFVAAARLFRNRVQPLNGHSMLVVLICMSVIVQALVLPVQGCTLAMMLVDRFSSVKVFDVARGGNPLLLRHLFWFHLQPAVLISILPAIGIVSFILEQQAAQAIRHNTWIIHCALVYSILGFTTWGIHMVGTGQSPLMSMLFSATSLLLLVPLSVSFPIWLAQLRRASSLSRTSLLFPVGAIIVMALGVLSGLPMAMLSVNSVLRGAYFEAGQFHFIGTAVGAMALLSDFNKIGFSNRESG